MSFFFQKKESSEKFLTEKAKLIQRVESISKEDELINNSIVAISNLRCFQQEQTIRAKIIENVEIARKSEEIEEKLNEPFIEKVPQINQPIRQRKRSVSNIRYATMSNFTLPSSISSHTFKANNLEDFAKSSDLAFSPSWTSEAASSYYSLNNNTQNNAIVPPKTISLFTPTVNVHKRTSTTPMTYLKQLITSTSIDSFLNPVEVEDKEKIEKSNDKQENDQPFNENAEMEGEFESELEPIDHIDLSKSLPNRNKKKVSVTRSFSYNIGKLTASASQKHMGSKIDEKSGANSNMKSVEDVEAKVNQISKNTSFLAPASNKDDLKSLEKFSNINRVAGSINTTGVNSTLPNIGRSHLSGSNISPYRALSKGANQFLGNELNIMPGSISSSDLQYSTSSLLALAITDDESLRNADDIHHVSILLLWLNHDLINIQ